MEYCTRLQAVGRPESEESGSCGLPAAATLHYHLPLPIVIASPSTQPAANLHEYRIIIAGGITPVSARLSSRCSRVLEEFATCSWLPDSQGATGEST
jgi:hypothetical protein